MNPTVLGLDPGTATTGYGVIQKDETGSPELVECGAIRTPADETPPQRLDAIYQSVRTLCRTHTPDVLAVEELFFNQNVKTAMTVSQARGVILLAGRHYAEDTEDEAPSITEYNPSTVKKAITGHGSAEKQAVQSIVRQELNLSEAPKPDDAADALALALSHLFLSRFPSEEKAPHD